MNKLHLFVSGETITGMWANAALAVGRVLTGLSMAFAHGWSKVPPSEGFIANVDGLGFPLPALFAWGAGLSELLGGILLALGLGTRPSAIAIGFTMIIAAFVVHAADPFSGKEMALLYLFLCVIFVGLGGGRYSLDAMIRRS